MTLCKRYILLLLVSLLIPLCAVAESGVYLVSVGIADYPGKRYDLRYCVKDAKEIVRIYKNNSLEKYSQLYDDKATVKNVVAAMTKVYAEAEEDDVVILFYSGHGSEDGLNLYDGLLTYATIRKVMAQCACKNKIIFSDACYSGSLRSSSGSTTTSSFDKDSKGNVLLFLSSRSNEQSREVFELKHGLFANFLQQALRGHADADKDRTITAKELYDYVSEKVITESNGSQHPVMWGKFSDNMSIIKW